MAKPLTSGEKIARDLCEMDAPIDNIIEVDPVDVARRIDEEVFHLVETIATLQSKSAKLVDALDRLTQFNSSAEYVEVRTEHVTNGRKALAEFKGD